jgi:hypothetical protein
MKAVCHHFLAYHLSSLLLLHSFLTIDNSKYDAMIPFGHNHSTRTPEQWPFQTLGLNFVTY